MTLWIKGYTKRRYEKTTWCKILNRAESQYFAYKAWDVSACSCEPVHLACESVEAVKALTLVKINIHTGSFRSNVHHHYRVQIQCNRGHLSNKKAPGGNSRSHNGEDSRYASPFALQSGGVEIQMSQPRC